MPQTDPRQGFTGLPLYPETYQIPDTLAALYFFLLDRSIEQYPTLSALQAAIPSPTDGMVKWVTADQCAYVRSGGAWVRVLAEPGAWTTYTPTLTNVTLGSGGTVTGRYEQVGKTVRGHVEITLGTGGAFTGAMEFSVPAGRRAPAAGQSVGTAIAADVSAGINQIFAVVGFSAGSRLRCSLIPSSNSVAATVPWTWAAGDSIVADFAYEAA
jgi:hypothetical protein